MRANRTRPHERARELLEGLSPEQRQAVTAQAGPLLVVAGAGSGKTRVLAHRVAYAIAIGRVRPEQVVAISFTNRAAGELAERIGSLLGEGEAGRVVVGTFHSVCNRMMRPWAGRVGRTSSFSIWDAHDTRRVLVQAAKELRIEGVDVKVAQREISLAKARLLPLSRLEPSPTDDGQLTLAALWSGYEDLLARSNALDFDNLIAKAVELLARHSDVAARLRERHRFVLVDEYQDTNPAQLEWLRLLAGERRDLTAVADDDQAIYRFRGAEVRNVLDFERHFAGARVVELGRNHRSSTHIVEAAARLIDHNSERWPKRIWTAAEPGAPVEVEAHDSERGEARAVAVWCRSLLDEGVGAEEIAVLYRVRLLARSVEQQLLLCGVPYRVLGARALTDHAEVRDLLAHLRLLVNPRDRLAFARAVQAPARGLGPAAIAALVRHAAEHHGDDLVASLRDAPRVAGLRAGQRTAAGRLGAALSKLADEQASRRVAATVTEAALASGLAPALRRRGGAEAERKLERLRAVVRTAREYDRSTESPSLSDFLSHAALEDPGEEEQGGKVTLATIHAAKGLEFRCVRVIALEEGLLPHHRSLTGAALEEERRLCYVAMTRAKGRLVLSWATSRAERPDRGRSRFLGEVGV